MGGKKEIYQYIRFFQGSLQLLHGIQRINQDNIGDFREWYGILEFNVPLDTV